MVMRMPLLIVPTPDPGVQSPTSPGREVAHKKTSVSGTAKVAVEIVK